MRYLMPSWYGWAPAKRARGGAAAQARVLCAIGTLGGIPGAGEGLGSMATLGGGDTTLGGGV